MLRRWLAPGLLLVLPVTAALSASTGIVQAVEECRLEPGWQAPPGSRWLSRINRDHHRCWFLSSRAIGGPHTQQRRAAHVKNRDLASDTDAVRRGEQRYSDLQTASAPKDKTDIRVTAEPPGGPQVASAGRKAPTGRVPHEVHLAAACRDAAARGRGKGRRGRALDRAANRAQNRGCRVPYTLSEACDGQSSRTGDQQR